MLYQSVQFEGMYGQITEAAHLYFFSLSSFVRDYMHAMGRVLYNSSL